jgi:ubiquinone/menaquinone biosynthesis C-methylase UbiE
MTGGFQKDMHGADWDKVFARQAKRVDLVPDWLDAIALRSGERVLEVGPGPGFVTLMLAERVGPAGLVYAVDPSTDALDHLARRQAERGLTNIRRIAADATTLADDLQADAALATMVLHHVDDPAALVANVARLLRLGARLLVAEFDPDGPCEVGPDREMRVAAAEVKRWLTQAGFVGVEERRQTAEHYVVVGQCSETPTA